MENVEFVQAFSKDEELCYESGLAMKWVNMVLGIQ
jgi:hypothetical protein